jgi:Sulfotransferase domain
MKLGHEIKVVWVAGPPRSGSMWLFNVARAIVRAAGYQVLPSVVPQDDDAMVAAGHEGTRDPSSERVRVVKVHQRLSPDLPFARYLLPRRDVRDALVSYMRFMQYDFEMAINFASYALAVASHYDAFPRDQALVVNYSDIVSRPVDVVQSVALFLEAPIDSKMTRRIAHELDKEHVARLIERKEHDLIRRSREGLPISKEEVVIIGPRNMRAFDTATGFQSGHVSNYPDGGWQDILTAEQKSRLDAIIEQSKYCKPPYRGIFSIFSTVARRIRFVVRKKFNNIIFRPKREFPTSQIVQYFRSRDDGPCI